jgi:uncharacterized membrane protein
MKQDSSNIYRLLILIPTGLFGYLALASFSAPIFEEFKLYPISNFLYRSLSHICHQFPSRSTWIMKRPMGLCSRCFAIYALFATFLILPTFLKSNNKTKNFIAVLLFLPVIADGTLQYFHLRESNNFIRLVSGGMFGLGGAIIYKYFSFELTASIVRTFHDRSPPNISQLLRMLTDVVIISIINSYAIMAVFIINI